MDHDLPLPRSPPHPPHDGHSLRLEPRHHRHRVNARRYTVVRVGHRHEEATGGDLRVAPTSVNGGSVVNAGRIEGSA